MLQRSTCDLNDVDAFCVALRDADANFVTSLFAVCFHEASTQGEEKPWEALDDNLRRMALRTLNGICLVDARACRELSKAPFLEKILEDTQQDGNLRVADPVAALALLQTLALRDHRVDQELRRLGGVRALGSILVDASTATEARKKAGETLAYLLHDTAQEALEVDVMEARTRDRKEAEEVLGEPLVRWLASGLPLRGWQSEEEQDQVMRDWWEDLFGRLNTQNGTVHGVGEGAASKEATLSPSQDETGVSNA